MISLNMVEVKVFMSKLLAGNSFDAFLLREMELQTFTGFTITGQLNEAFFSKDEMELREEQKSVVWGDVRQIAFSMIKGNKTPLSLKIVFQLPRNQCEALLDSIGTGLRLEEIGGLYLNIRFEKGKLRVITGTAIKTFTLDKTLEQEWDRRVKEILKEQGLLFEEL
ncbi:MAG TPA: hypothetical protein GXX75_07390 [Clostridiales bacterium]|nr:hypothetical protein [Clostridiales bacterium]